MAGRVEEAMELVDNDGNSLDPAVIVDISFSILLPLLTTIYEIQENIDAYGLGKFFALLEQFVLGRHRFVSNTLDP